MTLYTLHYGDAVEAITKLLQFCSMLVKHETNINIKLRFLKANNDKEKLAMMIAGWSRFYCCLNIAETNAIVGMLEKLNVMFVIWRS